jgi:hypothetical protein
MSESVDPVALYGALAAVAAITAALQTSATFAAYADVGSLESRYASAAPGSQELTDVQADARASLRRAVALNAPAVVVNAFVLASWGDVAFVRLKIDWVFVLPWIGVFGTFASLLVGVGSLFKRLRRVGGGGFRH